MGDSFPSVCGHTVCPRLCWPLRFQGSPQTHQWECFLVFGNFSLFKTHFQGQISIPTSFASLFIFCPTSFWRHGLPFWVPDVLCQHSEVVLWNLFSVQMFFWWIWGAESGLPILFLHHLRITPAIRFLMTSVNLKTKSSLWPSPL